MRCNCSEFSINEHGDDRRVLNPHNQTHISAFALRRSSTELRVSAGGRPRRFLLYVLYVTGVTGALVVAAVTMDTMTDAADQYRPGFGRRTCWFSGREAMLAFFGLPLTVIMLANVALFCGSAAVIRRAAKASVNTASSKVWKQTDREKVVCVPNQKSCLKLFLICMEFGKISINFKQSARQSMPERLPKYRTAVIASTLTELHAPKLIGKGVL